MTAAVSAPMPLTRKPGLPAPGVVVIQEIFGVNTVMRTICDGLAKAGFIALCPDIFWRQEPGVQLTDKTEAEWQKSLRGSTRGLNADLGIEDLKSSPRLPAE